MRGAVSLSCNRKVAGRETNNNELKDAKCPEELQGIVDW